MSFTQIDEGLNRYYQSVGIFDYKNVDGIGRFLEFCYGNEAEEEDISDELEDFENCMYLDFDEDFPFNKEYKNKDHKTKQQFIFDLIKECHKNANITFTSRQNPKTTPPKTLISYNKMTDDSKQAPTKVMATCWCLSRYYKSIHKGYNQLFSMYCHDSGVDDKELEQELQQDVNACHVIEFDQYFPFDYALYEPTEEEKQQFIFDLIKDCYHNPKRIFDPRIPQCLLSSSTLKYLYRISEKEYNETRNLYQKQCPTLWHSGMDSDKGFTYAISIGRKYNFNYLQHLVDDFHRARIENIDKTIKIEDWCKTHPHFSKLTNIPFNAPWKREEDATQKELQEEIKKENKSSHTNDEPERGPKTAYEVAVGAIKSYDIRCIPKLQFKHLKTIDDSLEIIIRYIDAAIGFVRGRIDESDRRQMPICPFQIDFCIGFGQPKLEEALVSSKLNESDDDDDDDDETDESKQDSKEEKFIDAINDIEGKLMRNRLIYTLGGQKPQDRPDYEFMSKRGLATIFKKFVEDNKLLRDKGTKINPEIYLHNKRLMILVDRRDKSGKQQDEREDNVWMYEPPKNCINIPNNAVPEWHISASKTCLLPNMEYGDGKEAEYQGKIEDATEDEKNSSSDKNNNKQKNIDKIRKANIGSSFHCKGALLTLSFIAKETNSIRCYLYWNGQMTRFMPQDCKTVLPEIINMKWNNGSDLKHEQESVNERFLSFRDRNKEPNDIDSIIKRMENNMSDIYFDNTCLRNI